MNIVHINTNDRSGGAAIAAERLSEALSANGIESTVLSMATQGGGAVVASNRYLRLGFPILSRWDLRTLPPMMADRGLYSSGRFGIDVSNHPLVQQADLLYLHWTNHWFLSLSGIEQLCALGKPLVVVMHDMWYATGGCHHSFGCEGYLSNCENCPVFVPIRRKSIASKQLRRKIALFANYPHVQVVAPSRWLTDCAQQSAVFGHHNVTTIPNPLNTSLYRAVDRTFARALLGLPSDKKIVCFGADAGTANPYKGWSYLQQALETLAARRSDIEVLVFGSARSETVAANIPFPSHFTGRLSDDYSLALIYNAIDAFVCPSLADNFPNTIVEAMACGAPVVGFDVGGIPDLVVHKKTGYLAHYKNTDDLAAGIGWLLDTATYAQVSVAAAAHIEGMCSYGEVVEKHRSLWNLK